VFIFIVQNRSDVSVDWLWFEFDAAMWLIVLVAFLAGGAASPLLWIGVHRTYRRRAQQRAGIQKLGAERKSREAAT
jgi:uncharacterized integral membrane protein